MKTCLFSIILCACALSLNAQSLLLKLNLKDCPKCQIKVSSYIDSKFSEIPCFLIFPKNMQDDSSEIKDLLTDKNLIQNLVFDDFYYHLLDDNQISSIAYLSKAGTIELQTPITEIDQVFALKIDSLYANDNIFRTERPIWTIIKEDKIIKYNGVLGYVKVTDSTGATEKYAMNEDIKKMSIEAIDKLYPGFYNYTKNDRNAATMFLNPKMGGFSLHGNKAYFVVKLPYEEFVTDSMKRREMRGDSVKITYKYAIVIKGKDALAKCYPISINNAIKGKNAHYVLTYNSFGFEAINDTSFLFFYYPGDWKQYRNETNYIALFKLRNGVVALDKQLPNAIPDIYVKSGIGYGFSANFEHFDYPYYIPSMATQIMDLENGKDYKFNLPIDIDFTVVDSNYVKNLMANKVKEPLFNMGIFKDIKHKKIYLFSCVSKTIYLTVFGINTMKAEVTVNLNSKGLNLITDPFPGSYVYYDSKKETFLIESKDAVMRSIPLRLLIPD